MKKEQTPFSALWLVFLGILIIVFLIAAICDASNKNAALTSLDIGMVIIFQNIFIYEIKRS